MTMAVGISRRASARPDQDADAGANVRPHRVLARRAQFALLAHVHARVELAKAASAAGYQTYFAASTITTTTTMAMAAICAQKLWARP